MLKKGPQSIGFFISHHFHMNDLMWKKLFFLLELVRKDKVKWFNFSSFQSPHSTNKNLYLSSRIPFFTWQFRNIFQESNLPTSFCTWMIISDCQLVRLFLTKCNVYELILYFGYSKNDHYFLWFLYTTTDPDCAGKSDGPYPLNNLCEAYYVCTNQAETSFINCQNNQYYDENLRQCSNSYPQGGSCQSKSQCYILIQTLI